MRYSFSARISADRRERRTVGIQRKLPCVSGYSCQPGYYVQKVFKYQDVEQTLDEVDCYWWAGETIC